MLVVGLIDIQHMQSVIKGFFFFLQKLLLFYWSGNPVTAKPRVKIKLFTIHLKFYGSNGTLKNQDFDQDFACLQQLSEGVSHNIEEKKVSALFQSYEAPCIATIDNM